jgi:hypothetical protein
VDWYIDIGFTEEFAVSLCRVVIHGLSAVQVVAIVTYPRSWKISNELANS